MKDFISLNVTSEQLDGKGRNWKVALTRKEVEDALAELNTPDPVAIKLFIPGNRVEHGLTDGKFMVVNGPCLFYSKDSIWITNLENGYTFQASPQFLRHCAEADRT